MCYLTKEQCPHYRFNQCKFAYHKSDADQRPTYQPRENGKQIKQHYSNNEYMAQDDGFDEGNIRDNSYPQRGASRGFRGGRGNNTLASASSGKNYYQRKEEGVESPIVKEEKNESYYEENNERNIKTPQIPRDQQNLRPCRNGPTCRHLRMNNCKFFHDPNDSQPPYQSSGDKKYQAAHQDLPSGNQNMNQGAKRNQYQKYACRFGANCREFKLGKCTYSHDDPSIHGNNEEVLNASEIHSNQNRDAGHQRFDKRQQVYSEKQVSFTEEEYQIDQGAQKINQFQIVQNSRNKFNLQDLEKILEIENDSDFIRELAEIRSGLLEVINNSPFERDMAERMVCFLERLLKLKDNEICRDYINIFNESAFFAQLSEFIQNNEFSKGQKDVQKKFKFMMTLISTMGKLITFFQPQVKKFGEIISLIQADSLATITQIGDSSQRAQLDEATQLLKKSYQDSLMIQEEAKTQLRQSRYSRANERETNFDESYMREPTTDFKKVEVIPGAHELEPVDQEELLQIRRKMPEQGDLQSPHNYLDILFRLLHEDAISDLRNGITQLKILQASHANQQEIRYKLKDQQVNIYNGVTIQSMEVTEGAKCIQFRLPMDRKRIVDWRITKKMMGGSLVILSFDGFATFIVGLLMQGDPVQRNYMHKKFGYIPVNIEIIKKSDNQSFDALDFIIQQRGSVFDMIESSAYFESYKHVLVQLKNMDYWTDFPMEEILVHGNSKAIQQPEYLQNLFKENEQDLTDYIGQMSLDQSQKDSVNHALNSNFALIQGPPGTGKTYVGVQLVKILIKYKQYWKQNGPILIVTYTNHALEQFLHFIKDITQDIVRIGGKIKTGSLAQFALVERLKKCGIKHGEGFYKAIKGLDECQEKISDLNELFLKYEFKCISTMISEDEDKGVYNVMDKLIKNFVPQLNRVIEKLRLDQNQKYLVQEKIKVLRQKTHNNIIVMFWLGIIDLEKLIEFIINDEQIKSRTYNMQNQIAKKKREQNDLEHYINTKTKNVQNQAQKNEIDSLRTKSAQIGSEIDALKKQIFKLQREQLHIGENKNPEDNDDQLLDKDAIIYMDERQQDYEAVRLNQNERVDQLLNALNDIIHPACMNEKLFSGAKNLTDCFQFQQYVNFQDKENADLFLQSFLNSKLSPYDERNFPLNERWCLNNYFMNKLSNDIIAGLNHQTQKYERYFKLKKENEAYRAEHFLKCQDVIAMTTTGRSKYQQYLSGIEFPIVIVEEAAEVFEAHILTSLTKKTQQVILIGDHEQLKPNPAVYELDKSYNLSLSMFERLIKNGMPHSTLSIQRRMRPEIARIMNHIYPDIKDYPDVAKYPNIKGVSQNVFFFDHQFKEQEAGLVMSKVNPEEAMMIVRFTQYILQQKQYQPENITILTLYTGQLLKINRLMSENPLYQSSMKFVKVVNVDNYQGEENEVIILSLVRSNSFNNIGFLKISNRVCVALSRAKHGLFIFGNSSCLISGKKPLPLWVNVINYLKDNKFIGDSIEVKCDQHGNLASLKKIEDFEQVPEGGCSLLCKKVLDCGHSCVSFCHALNRADDDPTGHNDYLCQKPCDRKLSCQHPCERLCHECKIANQPCPKYIQKVMEPCKHVEEIQCFQRDTAICKHECEKTLKCGHKCKKYCSNNCDDPKFPCKEQVIKQLPCGHFVEADCFQIPENVECYSDCTFLLPCGHKCTKKCIDCKKTGHSICNQKCARNLICGHSCTEPCIKNCPPCQIVCKTRCPHNKCQQNCREPCILCLEQCEIGCIHSKCTNKCSDPCNNIPCDERCPLTLKCGHPCIGICGLKCPQVCKLCSPQDLNFDEKFKLSGKDEVKYVLLEDCGHLFDFKFLDSWMMSQEDNEIVKFKECPKCKVPIMSCGRYMNQINKTLHDVNKIKAIIMENDKKLMANFDRVQILLKKLSDSLQFYNQKKAYYMQLYEFQRELKKNFDYAKLQRDCELLNQVIEKHSFINELLNIAMLQDQLKMKKDDKQTIENVYRYVKNYDSINPTSTEKVLSVLTEIKAKFNIFDYKSEIKKATDFNNKNWSKCPNSHYYAAGDRIAGIQISKCTECNAQI